MRSKAIGLSAIKQIETLARANTRAISLAQGTPSFATPKHIRKAGIDAILNGKADKYVLPAGLLDLRIAIADKLTRINKITADPETDIIITHGATEALIAIFLTILEPDDEIIVFSPNYATHLNQIILTKEGKPPNFVPLIENNGWEIDWEKLNKSLTKKTKAILLCNPLNPIGKSFSQLELIKLAELAHHHDLYIVSDEMYEYFVYEKNHTSIASLPDMKDRTLSVFGFSKTYAMTGWRVGYIAGPKLLIAEILKVHDSMVNCAAVVSQYAALTAISGPQEIIQEFKHAYSLRRQIVLDRIKKIPLLSVFSPQAAYYAFIKIKDGKVDDWEFAKKALEEAEVALVPGSAFGPGGQGHARVSFCMDEIIINQAFDRLEKWLPNSDFK